MYLKLFEFRKYNRIASELVFKRNIKETRFIKFVRDCPMNNKLEKSSFKPICLS